MLNPMKLVCLIAVIVSGLMAQMANAVPSPWEQPATALSEQVAAILGPGQAHLILRNLSTIPSEEIPAIRLLLEQDLKTHGVQASGAESANTIRVTLSEDVRERIWVAEVIEGTETRVAMVRVNPGVAQQPQPAGGLTLRKQTVLTTSDPVLAALETANGLVAIEPEEIVIFGRNADGLHEQQRVAIGQTRPLTRDPRAVILLSPDSEGFEAFLAGTACTGRNQHPPSPEDWTVHCRESDDPWPILQPPLSQTGASSTPTDAATQTNVSITPIKAFYNAARNYFTGVINGSLGAELPPFYSAALIPRLAVSSLSAALLINGVDGKLQLIEGGVLKPVSGGRDWGSDFAALQTGCGIGTQIVASGSGQAVNDSLRAYELPAQEAVPASAPLAMDGAVTALASSPDGKSILAVVRGAADQYEVDRVTATCN
jgi:hypothetical protein